MLCVLLIADGYLPQSTKKNKKIKQQTIERQTDRQTDRQTARMSSGQRARTTMSRDSIGSIASGTSTTKDEDVFQQLVNEPAGTGLSALVSQVTKQPTLPAKQILLRYVQHVEHTMDEDRRQAAYESLLDALTPPAMLTSAPLTLVVLNLSSIYESQQQFGQAVELLRVLHTDVISHDFEDESSLDVFRVQLNTRIAKDCLEYDDYENAEAHLTRISPLLQALPPSASQLVNDAQKTAVQVMISVGKWLEASSRLLNLNDETCDCALVTYALLAPATPFKQSVFTKIDKNEHVLPNIISTPLTPIFNKMASGRLIYGEEYRKVLSFIVDRNDQKLSDSYWADELSRAVVENNMVAASKIFANITLSTFTQMVELDQDVVEELVNEMVRCDRIKASVDDVNKTIQFRSTTNPLDQWQEHIVQSCTMLDKIVGDIVFAE